VNAWVKNLVSVCHDLARVLKPTGSLWLNVGDGYSSHQAQGAIKKSLLLGPQRLAVALTEVGWSIRNQVIWAKSNPMPSSVGDRLSCGYEVMLLCVRSRRYFFDLDAIRVPAITKQKKRATAADYRYLPDEAMPEGVDIDLNQGLNRLKVEGKTAHPLGKNPGDVWALPTAGFRGAHFATFPVALVEQPLLATCPEKVCVVCGLPWTREPVDRTRRVPVLGRLVPGCDCQAGTRPGVVLDPFLGAGTVALAAAMHGRNWLGVELNPAFAAIAEQRLKTWREQQRNDKEVTTWNGDK
jgi:site-specific DNA-methyltransferase (adenine-specific)